MMRLGLCCKFQNEDISFRTATATTVGKMGLTAGRARLQDIILHNASAVSDAVRYCARNSIGAFRVNSQIFPLKTHPDLHYEIADLERGEEIRRAFLNVGNEARENHIRLTFHPDQFVLLNSLREDVVRNSLDELDYQAEVAKWLGADVINIHGGGGYGDKPSALKRLLAQLKCLPTPVRSLLTLENDDRIFSPADLLPVCEATGIPLVYDVHHHRCLPDGVSVGETTARALATWNREPLFHLSSPKQGWQGKNTKPHHDYISPEDLPEEWLGLDITVDIEAKAKEEAVKRLLKCL